MTERQMPEEGALVDPEGWPTGIVIGGLAELARIEAWIHGKRLLRLRNGLSGHMRTGTWIQAAIPLTRKYRRNPPAAFSAERYGP
jgi:hypothetical protein